MCQVPDCQYQFSINDYITQQVNFMEFFLLNFQLKKLSLQMYEWNIIETNWK